MTLNKLASAIAKREGKRSQARIGDIREVLGILADMVFACECEPAQPTEEDIELATVEAVREAMKPVPREAHSRSEYRRLKTMGVDVKPPAEPITNPDSNYKANNSSEPAESAGAREPWGKLHDMAIALDASLKLQWKSECPDYAWIGPSVIELLVREVDALKAERDEFIQKYRHIELANREMSRNDHVTFGELYEERNQLRAENSSLQASFEEIARQHTKLEAELAEAKRTLAEYEHECHTVREALEERDAALAEVERYRHIVDEEAKEVNRLRADLKAIKEIAGDINREDAVRLDEILDIAREVPMKKD